MHTDGQGTIANHHLHGVVPVTAEEEAVGGTVEGIARHAIARDIDATLWHSIRVEILLGDTAFKDGLERTADVVEEEEGTDDLFASLALVTYLCL